mgnify:CR=1 FL=1
MSNLKLPKTIKMLITDFDGIFTDNCVYIDSKGEMTRKVNFKDVMAFYMLKKQGYMVGIISGEQNSAINIIKEKLQIDEVHQNIRVKIDVLNSILRKYNVSKDEIVYIGDDINDYDILSYVKYPVTVPDAVDKIKNIDGIQVTSARGGEGAFREVADTILG